MFVRDRGTTGKGEKSKKLTPCEGPAPANNELEAAIGREVRDFRKKIGLTVAGLAKLAGLSIGMPSKIEDGLASHGPEELVKLPIVFLSIIASPRFTE